MISGLIYNSIRVLAPSPTKISIKRILTLILSLYISSQFMVNNSLSTFSFQCSLTVSDYSSSSNHLFTRSSLHHPILSSIPHYCYTLTSITPILSFSLLSMDSYMTKLLLLFQLEVAKRRSLNLGIYLTS
jgi:hypothetical protein